MPKPKTKVLGVPAKRGTIMASGKGWRLLSPGQRVFKATLVKKVKIGDEAYYIGASGELLPTRKDQPPPDIKAFGRPQK